MSTLDSSSLNHGAEVPGTAVPAGLEEAALERQEMPAVHEPADSAALAGEALQPAAECAMAGAPDEQPAADPAASDNLQPSVDEPPAAGAEPVAEKTHRPARNESIVHIDINLIFSFRKVIRAIELADIDLNGPIKLQQTHVKEWSCGTDEKRIASSQPQQG